MDSEWIMKRLDWVLETPMQWKFAYTRIDDFAARPRVIMIWWMFAFKLFFRPWPFLFSLSFPTRLRLIRDLWSMDEKRIIWTKPAIKIGRI